jgi:hypothetical protein
VNSKTEFICPHRKCDYIGRPSVEGYGSLLVFLALFVCGIVPGLFYFGFRMGKRFVCPKCAIVLDRD